MRDDFPPAIKELLAKRVGYRCSNPGCRQPTSGPQLDPVKVVNVGVAAHITAASPDGPRYDPALAPEERKSSDNGVWLCQKCGKLIDNDPARYPVAVLREWKLKAEETAVLELEGGPRQQVNPPNQADAVRDFCNQLAAIANLLQEDLYRVKRQADHHGGELKSLITSVEKRIQDLRWNHHGSLLLPDDLYKRFKGVLMKIDELRGRDGHGDWHACFTLIYLLRQTAQLAQKD